MKIQNIITGIYIFCIFIILPLIYVDHYYNMAFIKWLLYFFATCIFLVVTCVIQLTRYLQMPKDGKEKKRQKKRISTMGIVAYAICVMVSFLTCPDWRAAWMGVDGWYMGLIAQMAFAITFWLFSCGSFREDVMAYFINIGAFVCFVIAIGQRYGRDWLHLYWNMPAEIVRDYLSTIGNRTWYTGYAVVVFPIGLSMFWKERNFFKSVLLGVYVWVGFAALVVSNSDSAYAAIFIILYILGILSLKENMGRYLVILSIFASSCLSMAWFRRLVPDRVRELRGLSKIFLDEKLMLYIFVVFLAVTLGFEIGKKKAFSLKNADMVQRGAVLVSGLLFMGITVLFCTNNMGVLEKIAGRKINNAYLVFNNDWGDSRGLIWKITTQIMGEFSAWQKLWGVGPDCFAYYSYAISSHSGELQQIWSKAVLANAHNEWLNSFFCLGIIGGTVYLGIFLYTIYYCLIKKRKESVSFFVTGAGIAAAAYVCHNFFCYQQICATPLIFIIMGTVFAGERQKGQKSK